MHCILPITSDQRLGILLTLGCGLKPQDKPLVQTMLKQYQRCTNLRLPQHIISDQRLNFCYDNTNIEEQTRKQNHTRARGFSWFHSNTKQERTPWRGMARFTMNKRDNKKAAISVTFEGCHKTILRNSQKNETLIP